MCMAWIVSSCIWFLRLTICFIGFLIIFEMATLSASNGGGNNMARAALTGAMAGAANGLNGIPERFLKGLADGDSLINKARKLSTLVN